MSSMNQPFYVSLKKTPKASMQIFCFPYLAGNALVYQAWSHQFASAIDLYGIEYPGHGSLSGQPYVTNFVFLINKIAEDLVPLLTKATPYAFFGHSLGALIAFEVARALRRRSVPAPDVLFVAACTPPQIQYAVPRCESMTELQDYLHQLGAPVVRTMVAPRFALFQADFTLRASYQYQQEPPLPSQIVALEASDDPSVVSMRLWQVQAAQQFFSHTITGSHLFLHEQQQEVFDLLRYYLQDPQKQREVTRKEAC